MRRYLNFFKLTTIIVSVCWCGSTFAQDLPASTRALYDEVMHYVKNLSKDKDFNPTVPPTYYYDYCFPCDKQRQAKFAQDSARFVDVYMGEETSQMKKVAEVMKNAKSFDKIERDMMLAMITITQRMQAKLMAAWKIYGGDPGKIPFLVDRMIEQERFNQLNGVSSDAMPPVGELLSTRVNAAFKVLQNARKELDYSIILNKPLINDAFRSAAIITLEPPGGMNLIEYSYLARFQFTIETKAKVQGPDGTTYWASLSNKSFFMAKPNSKCELEWTMLEPGGDRMKYELKDIGIRLPKPQQPAFLGPREFVSKLPEMKFDFCDDAQNEIHMFGFSPPNGSPMENWTYRGNLFPTAAVMHAYVVCFPDMQQYTDLQKGGGSIPSGVPFGFRIKQSPRNKEKVILEKTLDASETTMSAKNVVYGDFKIKIEHAPKQD